MFVFEYQHSKYQTVLHILKINESQFHYSILVEFNDSLISHSNYSFQRLFPVFFYFRFKYVDYLFNLVLLSFMDFIVN
jgi:hypothetical protein